VRRAVEAGRKLRAAGHELIGIRLDSGDLAYLSIEARKILDEAGFPKAAILASNDLDENLITSLKEQGAKVSVWGVGTKLVTGYDQPALGGVYKLSALRDMPRGDWRYVVKLSEQSAKISNPGVLQVRRFRGEQGFIADAIYNEPTGVADGRPTTIVDPMDMTRRKTIPAGTAHEDLLAPVFRGGNLVYDVPALDDVRRRTAEQLAGFHPSIKRFVHPHPYPAGLERRLHDLKTELVSRARGIASEGTDETRREGRR